MEDVKQGWHVGKTIDLSHILTTVSMLIGLFIVINAFDQRMTKIEITQLHIVADHEKDMVSQQTLLTEIRNDIKDLLGRSGG